MEDWEVIQQNEIDIDYIRIVQDMNHGVKTGVRQIKTPPKALVRVNVNQGSVLNSFLFMLMDCLLTGVGSRPFNACCLPMTLSKYRSPIPTMKPIGKSPVGPGGQLAKD